MTPGVQPIPEPKAMLSRFLITVVFPELGGPRTMTLGPLGLPMLCPVVPPDRFARMRLRSKATCKDTKAGCVVDLEEYCEAGKEVTMR